MPSLSPTPDLYRRKAHPPFFIFAAVAAAVISLIFVIDCSNGDASQPPPSDAAPAAFESYRDIPGVTAEDIAAIEALQEQYRDSVLVYGMSFTKEAFTGHDGRVRGYAALVSDYIGKLFGLTVKIGIYEWGDLLDGLASGEVSFTNELTPNEERRQVYHMTDPITTRTVSFFRVEDSEPLEAIARARKPRYAFFDGTTTINSVLSTLAAEVDTILVDTYGEAYELLRSGKADIFFADDISMPALEAYGHLAEAVYLPLIYEPVSLSTQQSSLAPIITVIDKLLQSGGGEYLNHLHSIGSREYVAGKVAAILTEEENTYLKGKPIVRLGAEADNYPLSFYNENEQEWQGITLDVLKEVEALTGIEFQISNDKLVEFVELKRALEKGEVSLITELIRTSDREGKFLWPDIPIMESKYALISKDSHRSVKINEVLHLRVGVQTATAYEELFKRWFPNHPNIVGYGNTNEMFDALERGDIDLGMSSQTQIIAVTNYLERPGYKVNVLFDHAYKASVGINANEEILCSIIGKALQHIDLTGISEPWMHKTYDYSVKLMRARQTYMNSTLALLFGVAVLLMCIVILLLILFYKNRGMEKKLHTLVEQRTDELNRQNKLLESVTKNYKGVIWSVDKDGVITMFEGRYLKTMGIEPSFLVGKNIESARQKSRHLDVISNVEKSMRDGPQDWMSDIDGGVFRSSTMPIYDMNGNVVGVTGSTDDITEIARLSDDLEEALEAAKTANRAKSAFLANMSHEIRTPLNSVIGFSELSLDYAMSEKPREFINKILENSKWLLQIINDILDISKIEAGKMTLEKIPFDLHEIFILCRTATIPKAIERGLTLHFYAEPFVGRRLVGDPTRLRQIFINLISNAIKFTNIGTVKVSAVVSESAENEVSVHFEVRDSGIGMTPCEMKKVLEPFAQADYSTTRKYGGTGLGLSIIRCFVEMMGGSLTAESTPGVGSKFSFDLKFKTVEIPAADTDMSGDFAGEDVERPMFEGEVLVCEDNAMNQEVVRRHLERVGLLTQVADNGKAGVDMVRSRKEMREKQFDLIFMDINMPVMDGLEAAEKIMGLNTGVPIVAMTANVMSSDRELYEKKGMHDCVGKPFTSQELWRCLLRHLKPVGAAADGGPASRYDDELLAELRTIFVNDNQHTFGEFVSAVHSGDVKLANRLAHTLKSNAGSIGKPALQKAAGEAERLLSDGKNLLAQHHIDALERELSTVLRELAPLLNKNDGESKNVPAAGMQPGTLRAAPFAEELGALLRKGSPDSLKFIELLRPMAGCGRLIKQMEDFDFDEAAETLDYMMNNTEQSNG